MTTHLRNLSLAAAGLALTTLAACGSGSDAAGEGAPTLAITSPDDGATVGGDIEVAWDSSEVLGPPESGRQHVHVFVDGQSDDYTVVGGNSFTLEGLSPGEHTVDVTLQHADHSSAGAEDQIEVTVDESGGGAPSPAEDSGSPTSGYDY